MLISVSQTDAPAERESLAQGWYFLLSCLLSYSKDPVKPAAEEAGLPSLWSDCPGIL